MLKCDEIMILKLGHEDAIELMGEMDNLNDLVDVYQHAKGTLELSIRDDITYAIISDRIEKQFHKSAVKLSSGV